jgi:hypothetical protein
MYLVVHMGWPQRQHGSPGWNAAMSAALSLRYFAVRYRGDVPD